MTTVAGGVISQYPVTGQMTGVILNGVKNLADESQAHSHSGRDASLAPSVPWGLLRTGRSA